ncbi:MAG: hypothetical protein VW405_05715 [Rhodospirillaceae bacterium]
MKLVGWSAQFKGQAPTPHFAIDYTLENTSDADISRVDGTITFASGDGKPFLAIQIARDQGLLAKQQARISGNYPIDPNNPEHMKLRDMPATEIKADIEVLRTYGSDNRVQQF